jgi:hypothetical protein
VASLSGVDKRFKGFVIMAGDLSFGIDKKTKAFQEYRQKTGAGKFDAFAAQYSWMDGGKSNALEKDFPDDTPVKSSYLPTVRAVLALNRGGPAKAVELLQGAASYELGTSRSTLQGIHHLNHLARPASAKFRA